MCLVSELSLHTSVPILKSDGVAPHEGSAETRTVSRESGPYAEMG